MTVSDLIEFLQTKPQDLQVAFYYFSEKHLLEKSLIVVEKGGIPRQDGLIQATRPDMAQREYLVFPGN